MKYHVDSIRKRYNEGEGMDFIFFWGHTAKKGIIKKSCLSQWYPCDFTVDGVQYHTTEQYMMAQKAVLFHDDETYKKIMGAADPSEYKRLGREVSGFAQAVWDEAKFDIVEKGNVAKFGQNVLLREYLLGTGDSVLVEASPFDDVWGVKLSMDDPRIGDPNLWNGSNLLGFALMEARDILAGTKQ